MFKQRIMVVLLFVSSLVLSGCENTLSGFGKDMQSAGQKIERSANQQ